MNWYYGTVGAHTLQGHRHEYNAVFVAAPDMSEAEAKLQRMAEVTYPPTAYYQHITSCAQVLDTMLQAIHDEVERREQAIYV